MAIGSIVIYPKLNPRSLPRVRHLRYQKHHHRQYQPGRRPKHDPHLARRFQLLNSKSKSKRYHISVISHNKNTSKKRFLFLQKKKKISPASSFLTTSSRRRLRFLAQSAMLRQASPPGLLSGGSPTISMRSSRSEKLLLSKAKAKSR